jgi:hypothetical protein
MTSDHSLKFGEFDPVGTGSNRSVYCKSVVLSITFADLISKLTLSVKTDITDRKKHFYKAFGAWDSKQTAEEIIHDVRESRISTRQIESF